MTGYWRVLPAGGCGIGRLVAGQGRRWSSWSGIRPGRRDLLQRLRPPAVLVGTGLHCPRTLTSRLAHRRALQSRLVQTVACTAASQPHADLNRSTTAPACYRPLPACLRGRIPQPLPPPNGAPPPHRPRPAPPLPRAHPGVNLEQLVPFEDVRVVHSTFGSACYIEDSFPSMLYLAYKYAGERGGAGRSGLPAPHPSAPAVRLALMACSSWLLLLGWPPPIHTIPTPHDTRMCALGLPPHNHQPTTKLLPWPADSFEKAVLANTNVGGENCHRGAALGALMGAARGESGIPPALITGLADHAAIKKEIDAFVTALYPTSGAGAGAANGAADNLAELKL